MCAFKQGFIDWSNSNPSEAYLSTQIDTRNMHVKTLDNILIIISKTTLLSILESHEFHRTIKFERLASRKSRGITDRNYRIFERNKGVQSGKGSTPRNDRIIEMEHRASKDLITISLGRSPSRFFFFFLFFSHVSLYRLWTVACGLVMD